MVRVDQAWGQFQASIAAHDNHAAYYGATEPTGHPDDVWGWAAQLGLSIKNIPTGSGDVINISGVYTDGATRYNIQDLANTHNWNASWSSSVYGAYAAVHYNTTAKTLICSTPGLGFDVAAGAGLTTCNPDYNIGQLGFITHWTPSRA